MFDHDAVVFNLQIENQHLREELHLYRQGQTTADLMDVLKDRDNELKSLRCAEKETKQKMVLLAKSSQELLKKLDILQSEKTEWKHWKSWTYWKYLTYWKYWTHRKYWGF